MAAVNKYIKEDVCKKCGGRCCQRAPGMYFPHEIGEITEKLILSLLQSGKYNINQLSYHKDYDFTKRGIYTIKVTPRTRAVLNNNYLCIYWTRAKGCELPFEKRPYQCRMTIPDKTALLCTSRVEDKARSMDAFIAWTQYHSLVMRVKREYGKQKAGIKRCQR